MFSVTMVTMQEHVPIFNDFDFFDSFCDPIH